MRESCIRRKKMIPSPSEIIDRLGGPTVVAKLAGVTPPSVCEWRTKTAIPKASLHRLAIPMEEKLGISRHITAPDVFGEAPAPSKRRAV